MSDETRQTVQVEMTLSAEVTVTPEICAGIADQYPKTWAEVAGDPEAIGRLMLYASVSRVLGDTPPEDWWDGVGNMGGLIRKVTLDE